MLNFSECKTIVDNRLSDLTFNEHKPVELYQPIRYILDLGGKRLRPILTLMSCNLFTENIEDAVNPAIAVEVFHNFTLLHDDIMDKAPMRRNHPTVHIKWNENIAILSGDAMNIIAYQQLCNTNTKFLPQLLETFSKTAIEICEGQQMDMNFETRNDVTLDAYLEMIKLKTAVLIAASLKIGAICAGAQVDETQKLYDFGLNLGLAFQIQDDLLDAFGTEAEFGKNIGGDILSCKKTFLYLKALELANQEQKTRLLEIYNDKTNHLTSKVKSVLDIFSELKIREIAEKTVTVYTEKAMNSLGEVNTNNPKELLKTLAFEIMSRKA